ncbi:hypothetical protein FHS61_002383 [Altererythrobacter atlanticus]|uniref:Uncharacterized protein n=1 Tax=Croceibacterium atlanticum TaxID=1267766 RepID=A0A0F7KNI9_9SPHN|nr:hypothetical protein [Croceibacterium atlanticum]AKH42083.1 hypothetical protein WYH_01035 [Croceibacterium atlanticum]MBB5733348.1 hypothetical protein [Croceibacterium atlanticum]
MRLTPCTSLTALSLAIFFAASPAAAAEDTAQQETVTPDSATPAEPETTGDEILVIAERLTGTVDAPQPPLLELGEEDIAAYGAGSIQELLEALGPQVGSSRGRGSGGRPVILVNGMRVSSFREMRSYPPEAIQKVEVFPEEVAQRYGYSPDQRVVNFILKDSFSSREIEAEYGQPWEGGYSTQEVEGTYLRIDGPSRLNLNLSWENSSLLTEAERDLVQANAPTLPGDPDPARYRSLVGDSAGFEATLNWTTKLNDVGDSLSVNGSFERSDNLTLQGLDSVVLTDPGGASVFRTVNAADPLTVDSRSETYSIGSTLNMNLGDWQVTGTLDGSHSTSRSLISRRLDLTSLQDDAAAGTLPLDADLGPFAEAGVERALTKTDTAAALITATGMPIYLPAGDVSVTLDAGFDWNRITSDDTRNPGLSTQLTRGDLTTGINVGIPITSRRDDVLGAVGDISLNAAAGMDHLSDFGTLYDWSLGVTWGLTDTLTVNATYINRDSAPSLAQLGNPEIETPNVSVFDLSWNETVQATVITGGNPFLPAQNQSDWKIGAVWELPILDRANFSVDYIRNHSTDVATGFPVLTPAIEAAFPDRVTRDASGRLIQLDQRPVTFAEQDVERLQFGLNLSGQIGSADEPRGGPSGGFGGRPGGDRGGPPAGGARGGGDFDPARFQAMRQLLCGDNGQDVALRLARGESVTGPDGQEITLPPMMLQRMQQNGEVTPEQAEQMRQRICSSDGPPAGGPQGRSGGNGGGAPGFGPPGGPGGAGRWFLNLQYTRELKNRTLVADGGPVIDLLDGGALSGGGQPRDTASMRLGMFYRGYGTFISGQYTGSSRIDGSGQAGSTNLFFDDYATLDIRFFVDLSQREKLVSKVPFLDNVRISFDVENIFDARQTVTDASGATPIRYQPYLVDPIGRSFEIEFRKLF